MKVYFTASARGKNELDINYQLIFDLLEELGHTHLDDLILKVDENAFYQGSHQDQEKLYSQTLTYIKKADVIVLEVSVHSFSMGYVLQKALEMNKPVVALHTRDSSAYFASSIANDKLQVLEYDDQSLKTILEDALEYAQSQSDVRFNFFISPRHVNYLDWVAKTRRVPRSVYLRNLIKRDMEKNEEYQGD